MNERESHRKSGYVLGGRRRSTLEVTPFARSPTWMWRGREVRDLVNLLRTVKQLGTVQAENPNTSGRSYVGDHSRRPTPFWPESDDSQGGAPSVRLPAVEEFLIFNSGALASHPVRLSERQTELARTVFGEAIACDRVRLVEGWVAAAPTTLGNVIRVNPKRALDDATLIHELTHVWQFQTRGPSYISNSLCAQVGSYIARGNRSGAYALPDHLIRKTRSIAALSAEQQAMFVQLWFMDPPMRTDAHCAELMDQVRRTRPLAAGLFRLEPLRNAIRAELERNGVPQVVPWISIEF